MKRHCWQPGCTETDTLRCIEPDWNGAPQIPYWRYCPDHAKENGFCYGCGIFQAGIEEFHFGPFAGLCPHCKDELKQLFYDDHSYDDYMEDIIR